jgi:tRNA threonylcarbamoyladenosine biosynthesis protein TsaE
VKVQEVPRLIWYSLSPQETRHMGEQIGRLLTPGQVIALYGELGAGKTSLVQGIARGLRIQDRYITSPTFTILNEYKGPIPLYHFDVYRLSGPEDLEELGYEEYFYGEGIAVLEWAEKIASLLPADHLEILLEHYGDNKRRLSFQAHGKKARDVLGRLRNHLGRE